MMDVNRFVVKYINLIDKERQAEHQEYSENPDLIKSKRNTDGVLTNLIYLGSSPGLYDSIPVTFGLKKDKPLFYPKRFTAGDPVSIGIENVGCSVTTNGVIRSCDYKSITVMIKKDIIEKGDETFFIFKLPNENCYKRMQLALQEVQINESEPLIKVAFGSSEPSFDKISAIQDFPFVNKNLNEEQQLATVKALATQNIFIIHGPPGTGKTTTLIEIIVQFVKQKKKVLVCAGSNAAVDNITEKLWDQNKCINMVRLGHIARFHPGVLEVSLDAILSKSNETICAIRSDIKQLEKKIGSMTEGRERHSLIIEKNRLFRDLHGREGIATESALKKAKVVFSTIFFDPTLNQLKENAFDVVIIDECSQITEPACWVSILKAKRCILAGDHCQLPPVVKSEEAEKEGLGLSLMERLVVLHGDSIMTMLTTQYRMHQDIMMWPSNQFYEKKLVAHMSVATHLLKDIPLVEETENTSQAIVVIDTVATNCKETSPESNDESRGNRGEADLVAMYLDDLINSGMNAKDIGVITPYSLQVSFIKSRLNDEKYEGLEIKSVDGFQGREKEAIVLSMVRSNKEGCYGFLSDNRRINVAITRAKRHLAMICNSKTVSCQPLLKDFLDYVSKGGGEIRSATQYDDVIGRYDWQKYGSERKNSIPKEIKAKPKKSKKKSLPVESKTKSVSLPIFSKSNYRILEDWTRFRDKYEKQFKKFLDGPESVLSLTTVPREERNAIEWWAINYSLSTKLAVCTVPCGRHKKIIEVRKVPVVDEHQQENKLVRAEQNCVMEHNSSDIAASENLNENDVSPRGILDIAFETDSNEDNDISKKNVLQNVGTGTDSTEDDGISEENVLNVGVGTDSDEDNDTPEKKNVLDLVPKSNADDGILHTNILDIANDSKIKYSGALPKCMPKKNKSELKSSNNTPKLKEFLETKDEDDFDTIIDSVRKADKVCSLLKCKDTVLPYLPSSCDYCKRRFCLTHFMPEIHGCGNTAKAVVRSQIRKEGVIYPGSGKPDKKLNANKKQQLHLMLQKKLDKCSNERKPKPKAK